MRKSHFLAVLFAVAVLATTSISGQAQLIIGVEDPVNGAVADIATAVPPINVGSAGSAFFDPFGAGFDTDDGIRFNSTSWQFVSGNDWVQISQPAGFLAWVLPRGLAIEDTGHWLFPGVAWNSGTPEFQALAEPDGTTVSDLFHLYNDQDGAHITFTSGLGGTAVPEPSSLALLLGVVPGVWLMRRRRLH
jgi:hypothetical protein